MNQEHISSAGILLELDNPIEIPENLRSFLTQDGMDGIKDFDSLLTDSKLFYLIPHDARIEYEIIYFNISQEIEKLCDFLEQKIANIRDNPKELIHELIQQSLEANEQN